MTYPTPNYLTLFEETNMIRLPRADCIYMYVCMYCMYVCMYILYVLYVCMNVCMYDMYVYICMYVCIYVCMYAYMYVCMYIRTYDCILKPWVSFLKFSIFFVDGRSWFLLRRSLSLNSNYFNNTSEVSTYVHRPSLLTAGYC